MGAIEIFLIIAGVIIIVISFLIKENKNDNTESVMDHENVKNMALDMIKEEVQNQLAMLSDDVMENTEARLDQLANQKIMAVGNYSEDVLKNIEENHNEVMFLYNMLNDKETTLKNTVRDIEAVKVSVKKMSDTVQNQEKEETSSGKDQEEEKRETASAVWQGMEGGDAQTEEPADYRDTQEMVSGGSMESGHPGNKERILGLYRQGKTNIEIAQELNLGVGEVNLVLGLFK